MWWKKCRPRISTAAPPHGGQTSCATDRGTRHGRDTPAPYGGHPDGPGGAVLSLYATSVYPYVQACASFSRPRDMFGTSAPAHTAHVGSGHRARCCVERRGDKP